MGCTMSRGQTLTTRQAARRASRTARRKSNVRQSDGVADVAARGVDGDKNEVFVHETAVDHALVSGHTPAKPFTFMATGLGECDEYSQQEHRDTPIGDSSGLLEIKPCEDISWSLAVFKEEVTAVRAWVDGSDQGVSGQLGSLLDPEDVRGHEVRRALRDTPGGRPSPRRSATCCGAGWRPPRLRACGAGPTRRRPEVRCVTSPS
jgi:hypothetical protein